MLSEPRPMPPGSLHSPMFQAKLFLAEKPASVMRHILKHATSTWEFSKVGYPSQTANIAAVTGKSGRKRKEEE